MFVGYQMSDIYLLKKTAMRLFKPILVDKRVKNIPKSENESKSDT